MEKIVTKIGDVTIERRVSKPQLKASLETPIGHDSSVNYDSKIVSEIQKSHDLNKTQDPFTNLRPEIVISKTTSKLSSNNVFQEIIDVGSSSVIKSPNLIKKSQDNSEDDFPTNLPNEEITLDPDPVQNVDHSLQFMSNENSSKEITEVKECVPTIKNMNLFEKQSPSITSSLTLNQQLEKIAPDISKLVGISIERKKKLDNDSQYSVQLNKSQNLCSNLQEKKSSSIENISSQNNVSVPLEDLSEDYDLEDSYDEDEFNGDENINNQGDEIIQKLKKDFQCDYPNQAHNVSSSPTKSESEEIAIISDDADEESKENVNENYFKETTEVDKEESTIKKVEVDMEESDAKESDINDFDLVELMQKGELEGHIEDVKNEDIISETAEVKANKRKAGNDSDEIEGERENGEDNSDVGKSSKKKKKGDAGSDEKGEGNKKSDKEDSDGKDKNIDKSKIANVNLRKNIREVMDETKLDEATLAAQRQEVERLKRLQEQQRIIREVQRQIALNRQNQKCQNKVLSLLQGNSQTSILKTSSTSTQSQNAQTNAQNSVLVKLSNGEQTSLDNKRMIELLKNSKNKTSSDKPSIPTTLLKQGMVTPSVSIAPIKKEQVVDDKKKKKGDIVTLSSDSEDDCIVLSDEDESEPEEDPTNSGLHTNDKYNLPDEQGRIVVNVGHPDSETDLYLAPQIAKIIKPHQIGGIRFLYDNVIESVDRFSTSTGFGCILAHSMGLGKTLQIVSFSDIFLRYTPAKTILCIMPINTIQNWLAEFNMWLPKESSEEDVRCRNFDLFIVNESLKNINARAKVILDWQKTGGVLLMGYELFRLLSLKKSCKTKKKKREVEEEDMKNKELFEEVFSALVVPGPDLVICDEGHRIKNSHATTSQALKQIRTKRRIVLTGYPLQNNLLEYWCMVDFVRPNYLGTKTEFSNMFERPIQNGQCIDSTPQDKRLMRYRAHVLHSVLEGFVQRRSHAVLQSTLPEKEEYVLLLRFTPFQRKLYDTFMNEVVRTVAVPNPLKAFAVCCKIWNHPDVLYNFLKRKGEEIDLDLEEALPPSLRIPQYPYGLQNSGADQTNQQMPPWPRRGPGSRGGKVRQTNLRKVGRGRKPAAKISPNVNTCHDKMNDSFNTGQYPSNSNYANQPNPMNYNQNQFNYGNEYNNPCGYPSTNFNKTSLNNLEDVSSNNFQGKKFFPQQNEGRNQNQYENPVQNFHTGQLNNNFNPNISTESNMNSSFESNYNSTDSSFSQNEEPKPFDFNQEFRSEFYRNNSFQNPGNNENYSGNNKIGGFQPNSSYFQNQNFRNSENFGFQSNDSVSANSNAKYHGYERSNMNIQNTNAGHNFQHSTQGSVTNPGISRTQDSSFQNPLVGNNFQNSPSGVTANYSENFRNSESNFESDRFTQGTTSNFQNNNSNFDASRSGNFTGQSSGNFQRTNYEQSFWPQPNWSYTDTLKANQDFQNNSSGSDFAKSKFTSFDEKEDSKTETKPPESGNNNGAMFNKMNCDLSNFGNPESESKTTEFDKNKVCRAQGEDEDKKEDVKSSETSKKEDSSLPYDWATDLFKTYVTGILENSSKMEVFLHIVTETIKLGDRLLVFSQSLLTLDLMEDYLHCRNVPNTEETWAKNKNYFRLDGSTPGLEREKLINEFNSNQNIHLFLVSTRAGSLGINLVGANRVVVFDASWNPCHDTQAVCRVYRYGQRKPCFVYRLVMDSCLEKKIYDRQVNKQGMADRVVDELNPDAHLSIKEVTNLCWDDQEDTAVTDFSHLKDKYKDEIIKILLERCSKLLSKEPFHHESLLIDRKEKKLSQAEKKLAKRSYELEKQAANQPKNFYSFFPSTGQRNFVKPIASVRPMQSEMNSRMTPQMQNRSKWIPAEVWQKQGMSAQEMTLPLDVVIPTSSPEKSSIVLKAGQRVMVLKSPKGIYMQLENGKIIAIRSALKVGQNGPSTTTRHDDMKKDTVTFGASGMKPAANVGPSSKISPPIRPGLVKQPFVKPFAKYPDKKLPINVNAARPRQVLGKAKPFLLNRKFESVTPDIKQKLMSGKMSFGIQEPKFNKNEPIVMEEKGKMSEKVKKVSDDKPFSNGRTIGNSCEKTEEKASETAQMVDSLDTFKEAPESIPDLSKRENENGTKYPHMNTLKNYRHNFTSQMKDNPSEIQESKNEIEVTRVEEKEEKGEGGSTSQQQGNENVQNWLKNHSYPPMDPYGNYFPNYYGYGPGHGPVIPSYEGFYPPSNYSQPIGKNSPVAPPVATTKQPSGGNAKANLQIPPSLPNQMSQNVQSASTPTNPPPVPPAPPVNTPMYPPYPNSYPYHYNYPSNPGFGNQGFPFSSQSSQQNQTSQQQTQSSSSRNITPAPPPAPGPASVPGPDPALAPASAPAPAPAQHPPYDGSTYSAFHRPDAPFQNPESPYPTSYPRPPYHNNNSPGFFPYNHPYPNYPYGHNFSPYMHPGGYGYPMPGAPQVNNQGAAPHMSSNVAGTAGSNTRIGNTGNPNTS